MGTKTIMQLREYIEPPSYPLLDPNEPLYFCVAGQSNAQSLPLNYDHTMGDETVFSATGKVAMNDALHDNAVRIPTESNRMDSGFAWMKLGDMLLRPVTFINVAVGGTSVSVWDSEHFQKIVDECENYTFNAVLWVQGETDLWEDMSEQDYYDHLKSVVEKTRLAQPGLVWYVAKNSYGTDMDNNVRTAQQRLIDDGIVRAGPDTDSMRSVPEYMDLGEQHFIGRGHEKHAELWYDVLKETLL